MDLQPPDYLGGIGILANPLKAMNDQINQQLQQRLVQAQTEQAHQEVVANQAKLDRQQELGQALSGSDGSAQSVSKIMMRFPEAADEIKKGWDVKDQAARQADLTQLGEVYSAASAGNWELAAKQARARFEADKAAGQADAGDEAIVSALESGDPAKQKAALTMIGTHLAAATGPEHFGTVFGALNKGNDAFTLDAGAIRYDGNGNIIAQSPYMKGADGTVYERDGGPSGSAPGNITPKMQAVASTLGTKLPAPVVAGFMGNFHIEGGYDGAQGDGGSASGIGQWRNERAANFQRVMGKPATEATPEEQAQFVLHEMQNPQEAGMTVAQRDQILAAKSPAQAAALIDKFYERSDGKARTGRMQAASAFAGLGSPDGAPRGFHTLVPGKQAEPKDSYRIMSPQENVAHQLDPNVRYQINDKNGNITAVGGQDRSSGQLKPVPPQARNLIVSRRDALRQINTAIAALDANPDAIGFVKGHTPEWLIQRTDPNGVKTRAAIGKVAGQIIHDVSGAAVTMSEAPRFRPYIPALTDSPEAAKDKLVQLKGLLDAELGDFSATYSPENGYKSLNLPGVGSTGAVKVRSIQEAKKLPSGTLFTTPDGRTLRKK